MGCRDLSPCSYSDSSSQTVTLRCKECDCEWEAEIVIDMGIGSFDGKDKCPECGERATYEP